MYYRLRLFNKQVWLSILINKLFSFFLKICLQWITQCFWNYLDWIEICHYIATCVVLGPDYQVYVCIAVLKHLQRDILQHTQTQDLQVFLKVSMIMPRGKSCYKIITNLEHFIVVIVIFPLLWLKDHYQNNL